MTRPNAATVAPPELITGASSTVLLPGEIVGAGTVLHHLVAGAALLLPGDPLQLDILLAASGSGRIDHAGGTMVLDNKATFVSLPGTDLTVRSTQDLSVLQISWRITAEESTRLKAEAHRFPVHQGYAPAPQYRDFFKSEKTISRTLIGPNLLPRFCMGSVESVGPDHIQPHAHPMLDQLFFSFPENDITLLIDGERHPLGGNTLVHIPLGSDHGVDVTEGCRMHYVWIDFFKEDKDMSYIVDVHKDVPSRSF